jgi:hypothetical protein
MSSSISNSDDTSGKSEWRGWLRTFALAPIAFAVIYIVTVLLDPFSTGRFSPITRIDIATRSLLYGHAARVRDTTFNAAVVGNSHGLPLDPARLTAATGQRFVQLSGLGLNPSEQLTIARAVMRNHRHQPFTLILVLDQSWCRADGVRNRVTGFFPAFIFESSPLEYLRNIISPIAVEAAAYRLLMIFGLAGDNQRRDGYTPLSFPKEWPALQLMQFANWQRPTWAPAADAPLPALDGFRAAAPEFDPELRLVLFFTRLPFLALPMPDSPAARRLEFCKARYREFSSKTPRTVFVDRMLDDAFARDMGNFGDIAHVHNRVAPVLEQDLTSAILRMLAR